MKCLKTVDRPKLKAGDLIRVCRTRKSVHGTSLAELDQVAYPVIRFHSGWPVITEPVITTGVLATGLFGTRKVAVVWKIAVIKSWVRHT